MKVWRHEGMKPWLISSFHRVGVSVGAVTVIISFTVRRLDHASCDRDQSDRNYNGTYED